MENENGYQENKMFSSYSWGKIVDNAYNDALKKEVACTTMACRLNKSYYGMPLSVILATAMVSMIVTYVIFRILRIDSKLKKNKLLVSASQGDNSAIDASKQSSEAGKPQSTLPHCDTTLLKPHRSTFNATKTAAQKPTTSRSSSKPNPNLDGKSSKDDSNKKSRRTTRLRRSNDVANCPVAATTSCPDPSYPSRYPNGRLQGVSRSRSNSGRRNPAISRSMVKSSRHADVAARKQLSGVRSLEREEQWRDQSDREATWNGSEWSDGRQRRDTDSMNSEDFEAGDAFHDSRDEKDGSNSEGEMYSPRSQSNVKNYYSSNSRHNQQEASRTNRDRDLEPGVGQRYRTKASRHGSGRYPLDSDCTSQAGYTSSQYPGRRHHQISGRSGSRQEDSECSEFSTSSSSSSPSTASRCERSRSDRRRRRRRRAHGANPQSVNSFNNNNTNIQIASNELEYNSSAFSSDLSDWRSETITELASLAPSQSVGSMGMRRGGVSSSYSVCARRRRQLHNDLARRNLPLDKVPVNSQPRAIDKNYLEDDRNSEEDFREHLESEEEAYSAYYDDRKAADNDNRKRGDGNLGDGDTNGIVSTTNLLTDSSPLYTSASLNKNQALSLTSAFLLKHRVSGYGMKDLIELMNHIVPGSLPSAETYWDHHLPVKQTRIETHHYCSSCHYYLKSKLEEECPNCAYDLSDVMHENEGAYFLVSPLHRQILSQLEDPVLVKLLMTKRNHTHNGGPLKDICCGTSYTKKFEEGGYRNNMDNLTLTWYIGPSPSHSKSGYKVWPLFCVLNELPVQVRRKNVMLAALWFGEEPKMDTMMQPFIGELVKLGTKGLQWSDKNGNIRLTKVVAGTCIASEAIRADMQCINRSRSQYGCSYCKHAGFTHGSGARSYPINDSQNMPEQRCHSDTLRASQYAIESGHTYQGVYKESRLTELPMFDVIDSFSIDLAETALVGVVGHFLLVWTNDNNAGKPYHIDKQKIDIIARMIDSVRPPREIIRLPGDISDCLKWNATEYLNFLLIYSPVVLQQHIDNAYYLHWLLLVNGVQLLNSQEVSPGDIQKADLCLLKFVRLIPQLYGTEHVAYPMHLLTHMACSVNRWGPLWSNSAFMFADAGKRLLEPFKGCKPSPMLLVKQFLAQRQMRQEARRVMSVAPSNADSFLKQLTGELPTICRNMTPLCEHCVGVGEAEMRAITAQERMAIEQLIDLEVTAVMAHYFSRFMLGDVLYSTRDGCKNELRDDSLVLLYNNKMVIGRIQRCMAVTLNCTCKEACDCPLTCILIIRKLRVKKNAQAYDDFAEFDLCGFLHSCIEEGYLVAMRPQGPMRKCLEVVRTDGKSYIMDIPVSE